MNTSNNPCPNCNNDNEISAAVCAHCGASLEGYATKLVALPENYARQAALLTETAQRFIDVSLIPEEGVGIYVMGESKPYYLHIYKELIIGRTANDGLESALDLTELNAVNMGVSRRHAMIQRTEPGYQIIDLSSRNGTWLNSDRLAANKPYSFASGSKIRIGQMNLVVMYHPGHHKS